MAKTWAHVEKTFQDAGINYQLRNWFYLCQIEGRQFYYSPKTGKWRLKRKRVWQLSQNTIDFIAQAKEYSPPENQKKSSNNQRTRTKQKSRTSSSSDQKRRTGKVDEIRLEFLEKFGQCLDLQRERHYKMGWIWYSLLEQFVPTPQEICWLCVVFKYSSGWAYHKIKDFYVEVNREQIFAVIDLNRDNWLNYFENRWGIKEDSQDHREQRTSRRNQSAGYAFTYRSYLELLKVSFPFTKQELKSAYRKKALETHPDSGGTAEAFREVNTAYQVLSQVH